VKSHWKSERYFIVGTEEDHHLLGGSQALPVRPNGKSRVKVKALGWLESGT
jgi:hypothetical protein